MLFSYVMLGKSWYHLHNLKTTKNTHGGVLFIYKNGSKSRKALHDFFAIAKWKAVSIVFAEFVWTAHIAKSNYKQFDRHLNLKFHSNSNRPLQ